MDKSYLQSEEWAKIRADIYSLRDGECEICSKQLFRYFHVHHLCYDRYGGDEEPEDLLLLCGKCHQKEHNLYRPKKKRKKKKKPIPKKSLKVLPKKKKGWTKKQKRKYKLWLDSHCPVK